MCRKCRRFGHFENKCKAEINKCLNCGLRCEGECNNKKVCSSCNRDDHSFGHESCPVRKMEENIMKVMMNSKITYFEAKDWIKENVSKDVFRYIVKEKDFPTLEDSRERHRNKQNKTERNNQICLTIHDMINQLKEESNGQAAKVNQRRSQVEERNETNEKDNGIEIEDVINTAVNPVIVKQVKFKQKKINGAKVRKVK